MSDIYWMLEKDPARVVEKFDGFNAAGTTWSTNPLLQAWVRNSIAYYSQVLDPAAWDTSIVYTGEQGELIKMIVPQARAMVRQLVSISTKQKLNFNAISETSAENAMAATKLANALLAEMICNQDLDRKYELAMEQAIVMGASYLQTTWRTDKGEDFARNDDGTLLYTGGCEIANRSVWDVFYDFGISHWDDLDWVQIRTIKNRYSLIAQHPDLEDAIRKLPSIREWRGPFRVDYAVVNYDDYVYAYELYHKPTPAIPGGRMLFYSTKDAVYHDGKNVYGCIPVEQIKPESVMNTGWGCPLFSSLLPAQEMYDTMVSSIATNNSAFAVQNIAVPRGAAISVQDIKGMNFFSYTPMQGVPGGGKPEAIQLTQTAPETFKFAEILKDNMQEMSMINAALRGEPPAQVSSGAAIATLTSTALEAITSYSKSGMRALEKTAMHYINSYMKFAKVPQMARIVGKNYESYSRDFIGTDLDPIKSVRITESNPLMQTLSGRMEVSDKLLQTGMIKDMQSYFAILEGAPPRELYSDECSEDDLIRKENDALQNGDTNVMALNSDDHPYHIFKHKQLLNDPKVRQNGTYVQDVLNHILMHYQLMKTQDPVLAGIMQTGKMPQGGIPQPPPPGGAMPSAGPAAAPGGGGPRPPIPPAPVETKEPPTALPARPAEDLLGRVG